jgi:replicative DNA helicase
VDNAEKFIFEVSDRRNEGTYSHLKEIVKDSIETIDKLYQRKAHVTGIPSGFIDFDIKTAGLQPSDLIVIAGRPSMGKSAFALGIAEYAGVVEKIPLAMFSLEMSKEQLVQRMLCSHARVDAHKVRTGYLAPSDWPRLTAAAGKLSEAPIFIDDTPGISVMELRAKARRLKAHQNIQLIILDYLQLMRGSYGIENRQQEISEISRSLKALARELHVPVIAISQLSRAVEARTDHRPQLSDLRESGAIEQDADLVTLLLREEYYNSTSENQGVAEVIIAKQRNGPVGSLKLAFIKEYPRFENMARTE